MSVLTLLATCWVAWFWWHEFFDNIPRLGLSLFALLWLVPILLHMPTGVALEKASPELLGPYTKEDLERLVREVCQSYSEGEIPKLYVVESKQGIAMAMNVDGLDFFRPWNALYVGQYFLHSLDELELKAVLAHEMCHFSLHHTVGRRLFYLRAMVGAVWMTTALSFPLRWMVDFLGAGWSFWLAVIVFCFVGVAQLLHTVAAVTWGLVGSASRRFDSHQIEVLCDLEAARRFGLVPMVNVLLKMGTRQEIFVSLLSSLSPDPKRPIGWGNPPFLWPGDKEGKQRRAAQEGAVTAERKKLEEVLPSGFVSLEEAKPYLEEALKAGDEVAGAKRFQHQVAHLLRWLTHDARTGNSRLDAAELRSLLDDLKVQPERALLNLPEEIDAELARQADHPSIRNRILFLAHNLEAGGGE